MLDFNGQPLAMDSESNDLILEMVRRAAMGISLDEPPLRKDGRIFAPDVTTTAADAPQGSNTYEVHDC
ncbi:MAG: hypothetical protein GXY07_19265 [Candidatus Hydrogenedentes bacterium]|nr:hypothetical protein [Candidatus Hydrogenedentota bacterium]